MRLQNRRLLLSLALGVAILAVSTASILIRLAQRDAPSLTIAALRLTFATLLLMPVALGRYRNELRSIGRNELILAGLSGLFLAIHFGTWISSLEFTSVASSVVLVSTGPLWVALLSPLLLRERLHRTALFGLGLAVLGGAVIGVADSCWWKSGTVCSAFDQILQGNRTWGNLLALAGAWAVSGYLILGRRLRSTISLIPYILLVYAVAAIALLVAMFVVGQNVWGFQPYTYLWIALLAIVPQLLGHSTFNWALRYLPAAFVAVTTLGEPIGSSVLAYFILHEQPGFGTLLGGILILVGIFLAARGSQA